MNGWICSYRSIWDHTFFKGQGMRVAIWHWLLHHAAYRDTVHDAFGVKLAIRRGEVCFSVQQIQHETGATRKQIRTVLEWLIQRKKASKIGANERANGAANARANARTILRIEKYDEYQLQKDEGANEGANEGADKGPIKEQGKQDITTESMEANASIVISHANETSESVSAYNAAADACGWPKVQKITPSRMRSLKARLGDCGGIEGWHHALSKAQASDFLSGRDGRWQAFGFDWLVKQANFTKLMEGNYENRTGDGGGPGRPRGGQPHSMATIAAWRKRKFHNGG